MMILVEDWRLVLMIGDYFSGGFLLFKVLPLNVRWP
jgi:hypothetical protein